MLRAGQLRNTMRRAAEAAGPPSERSPVDSHGGRPRASWHVVATLCTRVHAYVRDSENEEEIEDSGDVT